MKMDMKQYEGGFREKRVCEHCGKMYTARAKSARYCDDCRKIGYGGGHVYRTHRDFEVHRESNMSLSDKLKTAKALGLSYGQYVARKKLGLI